MTRLKRTWPRTTGSGPRAAERSGLAGAALRLLIGLWATAGGLGCLDDWDIDGRTFPCRGERDCASGFSCHPERFVCVPPSEIPPDAGFTDAASQD